MLQPSSEESRNIPQPSENFGKLPHDSETFGTIPNASERFRTVRNVSERTENHTLTVREVARLFEQAGVPRTERSIINWCQSNRQGVSRLDAFFDENERKYFITLPSVTRAIEEERAKQSLPGAEPSSETETPKQSESKPRRETDESVRNEREKELELQNRDLEITTRAKDYYLEQLKKERGQFHDQLIGMSRYIGELETQLLQLGGAPRGDNSLPHASDTIEKAQRTAEAQQNGHPFSR